MKRGWLAVALLAVMAALALWHALAVNALTGELAAALEGAEAMAEEENWEEARRVTQEAQERWDRAGLHLHITLDHDVVDQVSVEFAETLELLEQEERGEYSAANARLMERLTLLGEMERPALENLF